MSNKHEHNELSVLNPDFLSEDQQLAIELYEQAFTMPQSSPEDRDAFRETLEATDEITKETFGEALTIQLRHSAFLRLENLERELGHQAVGTPAVPRTHENRRRGNREMRDLSTKQVLKVFREQGLEVTTNGGGRHPIKIKDPETGTVVPLAKRKRLGVGLLLKVAQELNLPREIYTAHR